MIIDGKAIAARRAEILRNKIQETKIKPKLAIVLIGDDPTSVTYVNLKVKKTVNFSSGKSPIPNSNFIKSSRKT